MAEVDFEIIDGIIIGTVTGPMTLKEMQESAEASWQKVEDPCIRILWDLRTAVFTLSPDEVRTLAYFIKTHSPTGDIRTAFVVKKDLHYGLVRMFMVYRERAKTKTGIFRSMEEALDWLTR